MIGILSRFVAGALAPLNGLVLIASNRKLLRLAILPFVISLLVFVVGLTIGLPFLTARVAPFTRGALSLFDVNLNSKAGVVLAWTLPVLMWPALALALIFILINLTRLIAAPFYGRLAASVFEANRQGASKKFSSFRQTRAALTKTALFLVIGLVLGLLSFIPVIGCLTGFLFLVLLSYDIVDYALDALDWPLERRFAFFKQNFAVFIGLGFSLGLVFLVPGLNFFVLPASVVGVSDFVRRMTRE